MRMSPSLQTDEVSSKSMKTSEFFRKLTGIYLWGNLLAMVAVIVLLVILVQVGMNVYTHHGERIAVPNLKKVSLERAQNVADELGLELVVTDTGYIKSLAPGTILEQMPAPGTFVKSGRIIYITINAISTPTMVLPDVIDNSSYREAVAKLKSMGFKIGEPQYIPGEKNWVYGILVNNRNVAAGQRIPIEAVLVIQVGNGQRDAADSIFMTDLPRDEYEDVELYDGNAESAPTIEDTEETPSQTAPSTGAADNGDDFEVVE